jgi:hypothetical protein
MKLARPSLSSIATVIASVAVFAAGGHFAAKAIIEGQQQQRLQELTDIALRRSEVAVDFGTASVDEIARGGRGLRAIIAADLPSACLSALRRERRAPRQPRGRHHLLGLFGNARIRQGLGQSLRHAADQ